MEPCAGKTASRESRTTPLDIRRGMTKEDGTAFPLRWGILSASNIASDWCKCLREVPGASVAAVAARDPDKAANFAKEHEVGKVHSSYAEMVADPNVDIVYIGTLTCFHKEHSLLAIAAGKHVLCEKPLAESVSDAEEMFKAADEKGVILFEGMWTRFFPAVEHARMLLETECIGRVIGLHADFPDPCYAIAYAPFVFGSSVRPTKILAAGCSGPFEGPSGAIVQYVQAPSQFACATLSFPSFGSEFPERVEIIGTKGRITLEPGHAPTRVTLRIGPSVCFQRPLSSGNTSTWQNGVQPYIESFEYPLPEPSGYPAPSWHYANQHGFIYQAQAVHRCFAAGLKEIPQYTRADAMRVMEILEAVNEQRGPGSCE